MDEDGAGGKALPFPVLAAEASFAIVAGKPSVSMYSMFIANFSYMRSCTGSDTSGVTLVNIFYYLLSNMKAYRRLQAEIDRAVSESAIDPAALTTLPYLNAVMSVDSKSSPVLPSLIGSQ